MVLCVRVSKFCLEQMMNILLFAGNIIMKESSVPMIQVIENKKF